MQSCFLLFLSFLFCIYVTAQDDLSTCSITRPCYQGCCSASGNCGFGPSFCGTGCQSNCDAKAECGKYAPADRKDCPINVCCRHVYTQASFPNFLLTEIEIQVSLAFAAQLRSFAELAVRKIAKEVDVERPSEISNPFPRVNFQERTIEPKILVGAQDAAKIRMLCRMNAELGTMNFSIYTNVSATRSTPKISKSLL